MQGLVRFTGSLLGLAIVSGCINTVDMDNRWEFSCPDGYQYAAIYSRDFGHAVIETEDGSFKLARAESASGARYTDGSMVFWAKGSMAMLEIEGREKHVDCQGGNS